MPDLAELSLEHFSPHVGERFEISVPGHSPLDLTLAAAHAIGDSKPPGGRHPFSIEFRGPSEPILPQGTYRIDHAALTGLELFLVALQPTRDGARYEAVFA